MSILVLSVAASVGSIGLAGLQLRPQQGAADVVTNTAIVSELNGVSDAIRDMPTAAQSGVLERHGVRSETALADSLNLRRAQLERADQARRDELVHSDRLSALQLVLALFNAFAASLGAISLSEAYRANRRGKA